MSAPVKLRCAVYTRKSSEEGLDQEFNSLDAQREACVAFIASQASLGWKLLADPYDDGGISGGTMERPALQRLLDDIRSGRVDVVVVYKIDRLTRSLMDFSKIVEIFDANRASFVSVTQQFNTTTSMGRLTLNVLLSFAQFEREVTAERIRDKIAASKKKGMWMGGHVPLGYQVKDRKLLIHDDEAKTVRQMYRRYLELGSVLSLAQEINREIEANAIEPAHGPPPRYRRRFTRGKLYYLLANQIYVGKLRHHREYFDGEHEAIIDPDTFTAAQELLRGHAQRKKGKAQNADIHLLTGFLFDETGDRLSPTYVTNHGKRYRYYISNRLKVARATADGGWRVPAEAMEEIVHRQVQLILADRQTLSDWVREHSSIHNIESALMRAGKLSVKLGSPTSSHASSEVFRTIFQRITLTPGKMSFDIDCCAVVSWLLDDSSRAAQQSRTHPDPTATKSDTPIIRIELPIKIKRRGVETRVIIDNDKGSRPPDKALCALISRAHLYLDKLTDGANRNIAEVAQACGAHRADVSRVLPLAFLSPAIVEKIFCGQQPAELSARTLARCDLPLAWDDQLVMLKS